MKFILFAMSILALLFNQIIVAAVLFSSAAIIETLVKNKTGG